MRNSSVFIAVFVLSGCTVLGTVEKETLQKQAVSDARRQSAETHLAYLQCYPYSKTEKRRCRRQIGRNIDGRGGARTWDYILVFDHEAERLGFVRFLQNDGQRCESVKYGPRYERKHRAFRVRCSDGGTYFMRFDYEERVWSRVEDIG